MTRRAARTLSLPALALASFLASAATAGEPKTYRWVGEDGHVYTSTTPPPNGKGMIESAPATPAKPKAAAAPKPAQSPRRSLREILSGETDSLPAAPRTGVVPEETSCARFQGLVEEWRMAKRSLESAEANVDRLNSETDHYVRQNDSYHNSLVDAAEERVSRAEDRLTQLEGDAARAGAPSNCFTE